MITLSNIRPEGHYTVGTLSDGRELAAEYRAPLMNVYFTNTERTVRTFITAVDTTHPADALRTTARMIMEEGNAVRRSAARFALHSNGGVDTRQPKGA